MTYETGQALVNDISVIRAEIGGRIRDERDRLKMNQTDFAQLGGVNRSSQAEYEGGKRPFSADYLSALARAGVNVSYVMTGAVATDGDDTIADPVIMMRVVLPNEEVLAEMFEGLLETLDRSAPVAELARELALLLPTGLSQLKGLLPGGPSAPRSRTGATRALASADPEPTR